MGVWKKPRQCSCQENWRRSAIGGEGWPRCSDGVRPARALCARLIVIAGQSAELAQKVRTVPEYDVLQMLSAQGADQPFDERVRAGHKWYGLTRDGLVEHATHHHAINVRRFGAEANDAAREQIHDHRDPVALEPD